jgi:hypothetical protein
VVLLQEAEQPPWVVAEDFKQARESREKPPIFKDLPCRVPNATLSELKPEDLVPPPLQPNALLGHAEKFSHASGAQHIGVGKQS